MTIGQHVVRDGEFIPVRKYTRPQAGESIPMKNGIVCRASKSIIQMLLLGHQMIAGGL